MFSGEKRFKIFSDKSSLINFVHQVISVAIINIPLILCLLPPLEIFIKNILFKEMLFKLLVQNLFSSKCMYR